MLPRNELFEVVVGFRFSQPFLRFPVDRLLQRTDTVLHNDVHFAAGRVREDLKFLDYDKTTSDRDSEPRVEKLQIYLDQFDDVQMLDFSEDLYFAHHIFVPVRYFPDPLLFDNFDGSSSQGVHFNYFLNWNL